MNVNYRLFLLLLAGNEIGISFPASSEYFRFFCSFMKGPVERDFVGAMRGNVSYSMGPGYNSPQDQWYVCVQQEKLVMALGNALA